MMDLRPYARKAAKLSDYLPWAALIAAGVVLNKDGAFQRTMAFRGPDLDSATFAELMGQSARLNNALRRFGSGWCLHVEARRRPSPGYPESDFAHALAWLIDEERRAVFESAGARFESDYFLTLAFLPPPERQGKLEALLFEGGAAANPDRGSGQDYRAHLQRFLDETDQILALFETLMPSARWLSDAETLGYLHDCVSDRRMGRLAVPPQPFHLDALLTDAPLVGGLAPRLGSKHLKILSVRSFVAATEPGLLDALNRLPVSYRWVTRFLPLDREDARREIEKIRKRWFSKRKGLLTLLREALFREEAALQDNDAANQAADADAALQELGAEAVAAGFATLVIVVAEASEAEADAALRMIRQATDGLGFVTELESVNAVEAWLGSLPGQAYADVRRPLLLTPSLAHLLPTSAVWAGAERNAHVARAQAKRTPVRRPESAQGHELTPSDEAEPLGRPCDPIGAPPLMLAATDGATPFRLNLHVGDVGHTLIVGPTGAGKSVLLATLAAQWLRYAGAQVYLFDKGRSARATFLGLGGEVFDLGAEATADAAPLGFQPLAKIDDPDERAWAQDWLLGLIAAADVPASPERKAELWRALDLLAERPEADRTLSLYTALVQDARLRAALEPYTHAGPHGHLLDADATNLGYGAIQAFEMDDLLKRPAAAGAVLPVIFHLLEQRFTGRPTLLILDEAWLFLKDALFAAQIQDWLKTLRKRNVAVVFASQELADVERSPIASTILEACATRIFLPNDRAREPRTRAFYEASGLNERQIELIAHAMPKRDYYVVSRDGARLIELGLGPATLAFVGASSPEDQALIDRVLAAGSDRSFARAFLEARGLKAAADALGRFEAARPVASSTAQAAGSSPILEGAAA